MPVTIKLTDAEARDLAEMLAIAAAVAGANQQEEAKARLNKYGLLIIRLMGELTKSPSLKGKLVYSEEVDGYIFTDEYEETAFFRDCLEEFRDDVFWQDLVSRMADKAISEHMGAEYLEGLSEEERRRITEPLEKSLWQEVSKYGVDRLGFILPPLEG